MRRVLVLRPEPGASATVERAKQRGLAAVAIPLFEVEAVTWEVPEAAGFDGLLLTSANAVRYGGDGLKELRGLPVYAVGSTTADAAREAGFDIASVGDAGIERLLGSIESNLGLIHLAGENRRNIDDAPQKLRAVTVYRSRAKERVDLEGVEGSLALIHSPRAGRRFAELAEQAGVKKHSIAVAAISAEAADASGEGWASVESADSPSDDALLALAERLCNNAPRP